MLDNFGIWQAANSWSASVRKRPAPPGCLTIWEGTPTWPCRPSRNCITSIRSFGRNCAGCWERDFNRQTSDHINLLAGGKTASISDLQYLIDRVRMNFDPSCYLEYFDRLATHGRPVVGEITPSYCLLPDQGFVEMRKSIERGGADPRIVFVMRDPVQRFWSQC